MRIRLLITALVLLGAAAAPGLAAAYTIAYAAPGTTNMRAGPGTEYQVIARVLGGSRVNVVGCLSNRSWCDVVVQGIRGWISATRLQFLYGGELVQVPYYYSYFDVPVVGFDFGYWDRHYRDRPWYRDHGRRRHREHVEAPQFDCLPEDPNCNGDGGGGWDGAGSDGGGWDGGGGDDFIEVQPDRDPINPDGAGSGQDFIELQPDGSPTQPGGGDWHGEGFIAVQPDGSGAVCTPDMPC